VSHRIIETEDDIAEGTAALIAACKHMARVHALTGAPPLRRRPGGFEGLARIIVGQQLSIASAEAIWGRTQALAAPFTPEVLLKLREPKLKRAGLSAGKIRTLRGVAEAAASGALDLDALVSAEDDEAVRAQLTQLKGIGPWTADIYAMFCLGRADAWAPGDLALKYAVQDAMKRKALPSEADMMRIAKRWQPWRSVAARLLWSYYRLRRQARSGAPV
jgi:DNA-3-methyladenine glycosylase II